MLCVDTTFCVELSKGEPAAITRAKKLDAQRERLAVPAPFLTGFLIGGFAKGGHRLKSALDLNSRTEVLPVNGAIALEAARLAGQAIQDGRPIGTLDLLIAATARVHHVPIIMRDRDFSAVPGLTIETY